MTAASRSSESSFQAPVIPAKVDYSSEDDLIKLFTGQDAVIEAFNPIGASLQPTIVDAALKAGVKHIITPDFAGDTFNPHVPELLIYQTKVAAQKRLEERVAGTELKWTAIITGAWFDWGTATLDLFSSFSRHGFSANCLSAIPRGYFWVNPKKKTVVIYGSGNQRYSMCHIPTAAKAVVDVLSDPVKFANRPIYVADHTVSTNQLIPILEEISPGWDVQHVDVDDFFAAGKRTWDEDTKAGVKVRLASEAYAMLGTYGIFEENNRYGADFEDMIEPGYGYKRDRGQLKEDLRELVSASSTT